jgi:hypothetical protein
MVHGIRFNCYQAGIARTEWRSADGRAVVGCNRTHTYWSAVDNVTIGKRHRDLHAALNAAAKALAARSPALVEGEGK